MCGKDLYHTMNGREKNISNSNTALRQLVLIHPRKKKDRMLAGAIHHCAKMFHLAPLK